MILLPSVKNENSSASLASSWAKRREMSNGIIQKIRSPILGFGGGGGGGGS